MDRSVGVLYPISGFPNEFRSTCDQCDRAFVRGAGLASATAGLVVTSPILAQKQIQLRSVSSASVPLANAVSSTAEQLESALKDYRGAFIVVSHESRFLETIRPDAGSVGPTQ